MIGETKAHKCHTRPQTIPAMETTATETTDEVADSGLPRFELEFDSL